MKFIITEKQKKKVYKKKLSELINDEMEKNSEFALKLFPNIKNSSSIGGFLRPVEDYIKDTHQDLKDNQIDLILKSICCIYFGNDKKELNKLFKSLKKENLDKKLPSILKKTDELYNKFSEFLSVKKIGESKKESVKKFFSFIPILPKMLPN